MLLGQGHSEERGQGMVGNGNRGAVDAVLFRSDSIRLLFVGRAGLRTGAAFERISCAGHPGARKADLHIADILR